MTRQHSKYIDDRVHSVHDALSKAAARSHIDDSKATLDGQQMVRSSYRAFQQTIDLADDICRNNGTTVSQFLRMCLEGLVQDYLPGAKPGR